VAAEPRAGCRLPRQDSVAWACAGPSRLGARPLQGAAAFRAGPAPAGAARATGDAGLPFPPALAAPPPHLLIGARAEPIRVEVTVADRVELGQIGAQGSERPLAGDRPPRAASGAAGTVLRGHPPFVPAAPAPPPQRLHRPPRNRVGVQVAVAGRVQFCGQVGALDRERPLAWDVSSASHRREPAALRSAMPTHSCVQEADGEDPTER
jgi:hypothetical protein